MKTKSQLQKSIMRRVYYTFGIRIATHPLTTHMVVLGFSVLIFARLVHIAAVYRNMMHIEVGELGSYVLRVFTHADMATLLALGLIIFTCLSLQWKFVIPKLHHTQAV
jgi:hypothetical protein